MSNKDFLKTLLTIVSTVALMYITIIIIYY